MNKSGDIGTKTETATVQAIRTRGFPHAERRRLRGRDDAGDITGTPGVCWEVKGGNDAKTASDQKIREWLNETEIERHNSSADVGILVVARKGIGYSNAHRWWAIVHAIDASCLMDRKTSVRVLLNQRMELQKLGAMPVRMHLEDMCRLLVHAGYGEVTS